MLADFTRRVSRKTPETRARQGIWRFGSRIQEDIQSFIYILSISLGRYLCFAALIFEGLKNRCVTFKKPEKNGEMVHKNNPL